MLNKKFIVGIATIVIVFLGVFVFAQNNNSEEDLAKDETAPIITLTGDESITIVVGSTYEEAGAAAKDDIDGNITTKIKTSGNVDADKVGTYTIAYNVKDEAGNAAKEVKRTITVVDNTKPVIKMLGNSPVTIEAGKKYVDEGATAYDNYDHNITGLIVTTSNIDTSKVGTYHVIYNVTDSSDNNAKEVTRTVYVVDTTAPTINLIGSDPVTNEVYNAYHELGATATDIVDGNLTSKIVVTNNINTALLDTYKVTYEVTDKAGNTAKLTRDVVVQDTTAPTITLVGDDSITVKAKKWGTFTDHKGATALDNYDGDLTSTITSTNDVKLSVPGTYSIIYTVIDAAGNTATLSRAIIVKDMVKPTIMLKGWKYTIVPFGGTYTDKGAMAYDDIDGNISNQIVVTGNVNTSIVGFYRITYNVTDSSGNAAKQVTRFVIVKDSEKPVIGLLGGSDVTVQGGSIYKDARAIATDNADGVITNKIVTNNPVNTMVVGDYDVTYNVTDSSGNKADQVVRHVHVIDTIAPTININGISPINIELGSTYTDLGATATDIIDGNLTSSIVTVNPVNTSATGTYYVTYNVVDNHGNHAAEVIRTVNVIDTTAPDITFVPNGTSSYVKTAGVTVNAADLSGIEATSLKYIWADSETTITYDDFVASGISFTNGATINTPVGATGTYSLWTYAIDNNHNGRIAVSSIFYLDNVAPIIDLFGHATKDIEAGSTSVAYKGDMEVTDNIDGHIDFSYTGTVDTSVVGSYPITYVATDGAGNTSTATRTFNVVDTVSPSISFGTNGNTTYATSHSTTVSVSDLGGVNSSSLKYLWSTLPITPSETDFSATFTSGGTISTPSNVTGGYYLWVIAKDNTGHTTITSSNIFNIDNQGPNITLSGTNPVSVPYGSTYTDAGATANDTLDGPVAVSSDLPGSVNTSIPGTYTVHYTAMDTHGNVSARTRTVEVTDGIAPTITFGTNGNSTYAHQYSSTITVTDTGSGVNISSLKYQWTNSTTTPTEVSFSSGFSNGDNIYSFAGTSGSLYLWALAKDNYGNTAISRTNVFNIDNTGPTSTITLNGDTTYSKTKTATVNVIDLGSGINASSLRSLWSTSATTPADSEFVVSLTNGGTVNTPSGNPSGQFYLWIKASDNLGNTSYTKSASTFNLDNQGPSITYGTNGNSSYARNASTTINVTDAGSGISASTLKYFWTTSSSSAAPSESSFTNTYTNGSTVNTPTGVNGSYYLWTMAYDNAGNPTYSRTGAFYLDSTLPTASFHDNWILWWIDDVTVTASDTGGSGLNTSNLKYQWTTSTTAPSEASFDSSGTSFTNGHDISYQDGKYLWIRVYDNAGNLNIIRRS